MLGAVVIPEDQTLEGALGDIVIDEFTVLATICELAAVEKTVAVRGRVVVFDLVGVGVGGMGTPPENPVPVAFRLIRFCDQVGSVRGYGAVVDAANGVGVEPPVPRGREERVNPVLKTPDIPLLAPLLEVEALGDWTGDEELE